MQDLSILEPKFGFHANKTRESPTSKLYARLLAKEGKDNIPLTQQAATRKAPPGDSEGKQFRSLFKDYASIFGHTFFCVDSLLAWFCKQHQSRGHRRSHMTCDAFPQGEFSCYTFCGSRESSTLCTHISHPRFSQHIPPQYLGDIRK